MKQEVNPPVVHAKDCTGCKRCVTVCPSFVLEMVEAKSEVVRGDWCIGCGHCGAVCQTGAILYEECSFDMHPKEGEAPSTSPSPWTVRRFRATRWRGCPRGAPRTSPRSGRRHPAGTRSRSSWTLMGRFRKRTRGTTPPTARCSCSPPISS